MELRDHQVKALNMIKQSLVEKKKRPIVAAPCSFGKTILAAHIAKSAQDKGNKFWFFCDRIQLVNQTIEKFMKLGIDFGVRQANHPLNRPSATVQIASIQTISAMVFKHGRPLPEFDISMVDECFTQGTLIKTTKGDIPIELVRTGDKVYNAIGIGEVEAVMTKFNKKTLIIELSNGKKIECTENHPFFTEKGWQKAGELDVGSRAFSIQDMPAMWEYFLSKEKGWKSSTNRDGMESEKNLLTILCEEIEKPYAQPFGEKESFGIFKEDGAQAANSRREWTRGNSCSEIIERAFRFWMDFGNNTDNRCKDLERRKSSESLQDRYSKQEINDSNRDRWVQSLLAGKEKTRQKKRQPFSSVRVESIKVVKQQCDKAVFNLQVSGHPSYFAEGILVHNCHTQHKIIKHISEIYNNNPMIGLSATPYSKGLGKIYNNLLVPITTRQLEAKGYLTKIRYFGGASINLKKVKSKNANKYVYDDIARETNKGKDELAGCIVRNWLEHGENSQTIAFSPTQEMSRALVEKLNAAGITAEHIDCNHVDEERQRMFAAHDRGDFKVLSCSRLLNTGYDAPSVRCIIDCYPIKSVTDYVQRAGRIQRLFPGKEYAIYLDHAGNFDEFGGPAEDIVPESLHDGEQKHSEKKLTNKDKEKKSKTQQCPSCYQEMVYPFCKACGYRVPPEEMVVDDGSDLVQLTASEQSKAQKKANNDWDYNKKAQFLSELIHYANKKRYKPGWAANNYREKFGVWPSKIKGYDVNGTTHLLKGWLQHKAIKYKNSKKAS